MTNELTPKPELKLPNGEVNIHCSGADVEFTALRERNENGAWWIFNVRAPIAVKEQDGHDIWATETFKCTSQQAVAIMALFTDEVEDDNLRLTLYKIAEPVFVNLQRPFHLIP